MCCASFIYAKPEIGQALQKSFALNLKDKLILANQAAGDTGSAA